MTCRNGAARNRRPGECPKFVPLNRKMHGDKTWKRGQDYRFAASDQAVPIVAHEVAAASSELPLGFVRMGEAFELAALVSRRAGENLYVASDGTWLVNYVPAILRAHPFRLLRLP